MKNIFEKLKGQIIVDVKIEDYTLIIEVEEKEGSTIVLSAETSFDDLEGTYELAVEAKRKKTILEPLGSDRI